MIPYPAFRATYVLFLLVTAVTSNSKNISMKNCKFLEDLSKGLLPLTTPTPRRLSPLNRPHSNTTAPTRAPPPECQRRADVRPQLQAREVYS